MMMGRFAPSRRLMADYDLAIIGGGLNGVSLARDAAGRGLRVVLFEQAISAPGRRRRRRG